LAGGLQLMAPIRSAVFEDPSRLSARSARRSSYSASPPLDGVMLWMAGAVYECQVTVEPEQIFCNLLGVHVQHSSASASSATTGLDDDEGDRKAELLGTALQLDVLQLYTFAARECVQRSEFRRAKCLFQLAGASPDEVIRSCLGVGCPAVIMTELAELCAGGPQGASQVGVRSKPPPVHLSS